MDTDVIYTLQVKTVFQKEEFTKIMGSKRIDKKDHDKMYSVKKEYEDKFMIELKEAIDKSSGFIYMETENKNSGKFFNINSISYFHVTFEAADY